MRLILKDQLHLLGGYKLLYEDKCLKIHTKAFKWKSENSSDCLQQLLLSTFYYTKFMYLKGGGLNENDPNLSFDDNYF